MPSEGKKRSDPKDPRKKQNSEAKSSTAPRTPTSDRRHSVFSTGSRDADDERGSLSPERERRHHPLFQSTNRRQNTLPSIDDSQFTSGDQYLPYMNAAEYTAWTTQAKFANFDVNHYLRYLEEATGIPRYPRQSAATNSATETKCDSLQDQQGASGACYLTQATDPNGPTVTSSDTDTVPYPSGEEDFPPPPTLWRY